MSKPAYLFFWDGVFSNFYPISGDDSFTSEKIYMAQKAMAFHDVEGLRLINHASTPRIAKKLGRAIKGFDEGVWEGLRTGAMLHALHIKFAACPEFRDELRASGNLILVEASPDDKIWGIGFAEADALENEDNWGLNLLGKCLMGIRHYYFGT